MYANAVVFAISTLKNGIISENTYCALSYTVSLSPTCLRISDGFVSLFRLSYLLHAYIHNLFILYIGERG